MLAALGLAGCGGGGTSLSTPDGASAATRLPGRIAYSQFQPTTSVAGGAEDGRRSDIYLVRADGTQRRRLTPDTLGTSNRTPVLSRAGDRIAFVSSSADLDADIYTVATDGSDLKRVTLDGAAQLEAHPAWTPDGRSLVFAAEQSTVARAATRGAAIFIIGAQGGTARRVLQTPEPITGLQVTPDGRNVVYGTSGSTDFSDRLNIAPLNGSSAPRLLTDELFSELRFAISSDGKRLALITRDPETRAFFSVITSDLEGSNRRILFTRNFSFRNIEWSPDGQYLAYEISGSFVPPPYDTVDGQIYIVRADDGSGLPGTAGTLGLGGVRGGQFSPSWGR